MVFSQLVDWTEKTFLPFGTWGLFWVSFMESSFFPIPSEILLLLLVLITPHNWLFYGIVCTAGSVIGALFGYWLGWKFGLPLLRKMVKKRTINKMHAYFEKYEAWAIGIAAFTPIPYKVFTIGAGVFYVDLKVFTVVSILGRGARFIPEAFLMAIYGRRILEFAEVHFVWVTIFCLAVLGLWFYFKPPE